jgi:BirA family biotin operon repressor/biotin-[acetyl-CoA-carboxylase] ligase
MIGAGNGKKVGGILCESIVQGERWAGIVGIGINVNTRVEELPPEVRGKATSLSVEGGKPRDTREVEAGVLQALGRMLELIEREGIALAVARARTLDALRGKEVELRDGARVVKGTGAGIGDAGDLLIQTDKGIVGCMIGTLQSVGGEALRPPR